jgi:ABC-type sugar transport system ATPase subunit
MSAITLQNVSRRFGKNTVIENLSLEIKDKELIVFLGPSGCGKSTTMNMLAGIDRPTSGRIYFDDDDVTDKEAHLRNVAMVFQSAILYPHLTAKHNIRMSLRITNLRNEEKERKIWEVSKLLGIEDLLDRLPSQLSGGERQRVATAKAFVRNPKVFLMDEPLASLDAALREVLRGEIAVLQKRVGITMVFVTHDQVEAMTLGDRIVVMRKGELQQIGTPDEIYNQPRNTFVATFVGSPPMNLFGGTTKADSKGRQLFHHVDFEIELPETIVEQSKGKLRDNQPVKLGCRPQDIELRETREADVLLEAHIHNVEKLGKETVVTFNYRKDRDKVKAIVSGLYDRKIGDQVYALFNLDKLFLFDEETGLNLCT